jgi:RNA polymerase sigma-70 factor (ECF subfamily)
MAGVQRQMSESSLSSSLLQRVVALDPQAWQRLFQLHGPLVYSRCRSCGLQPDDAADLVQEVFLAAMKSIPSFGPDRPNSSFRRWLWGITRNKLKDHWEARGRNPQAEGGSDAQRRIDELAGEGDEPSTGTEHAGEQAGLMRRALELIRVDFQERTWKAFWRFEIDGQPAAEVGSELGMTANAVHVAASRVRRRLREEFAELL